MSPLITVVVLNWQRPDNLQYTILPMLDTCPVVGEIIISHGKPETQFKWTSRRGIPVVHRDDGKLNDKYGLSLRFLASSQATYDDILLVDDDTVPHPSTIINMINTFQRDAPCIVGKYGRFLTNNGGYCSDDIPKQITRAPIVLTSLVLFPKYLVVGFFQESSPIVPWIKTHSDPFWNGEDIFLSLLSVSVFNKWPRVVGNDQFFPVRRLRTTQDTQVAISRRPGHHNYRSRFVRKCLAKFKLSGKEIYLFNK